MVSRKNVNHAVHHQTVLPRFVQDLETEHLINAYSTLTLRWKNASRNQRMNSVKLALLALTVNLINASVVSVSPPVAQKNLFHVDSRRSVTLAAHHPNVLPRIVLDLETEQPLNVCSILPLQRKNVSLHQRKISVQDAPETLTVNLESAGVFHSNAHQLEVTKNFYHVDSRKNVKLVQRTANVLRINVKAVKVGTTMMMTMTMMTMVLRNVLLVTEVLSRNVSWRRRKQNVLNVRRIQNVLLENAGVVLLNVSPKLLATKHY